MSEIILTALFIYVFLGLVIGYCCFTGPDMPRFESPLWQYHLLFRALISFYFAVFVIAWLPLVVRYCISSRFPDEPTPDAEPPQDFGPGYDR
jgi:hypothetical protein